MSIRPGIPAVPRRDALEATLSAVHNWHAGTAAGCPLVVAIDGYGASGKSTLAEHVVRSSGAALLHTDDFFRVGGPAAEGDLPSYYDLARLREEALVPLRAGRAAGFRVYDWSTGLLAPSTPATALAANETIVLDGVCSGAPALADLVDRAIFVETPEPERLRRLHESVDPAEWDEAWLTAERAYFGVVRPPASFDLVVSGSEEAEPGRGRG